jgi:hypothetical protein
VPKGTKVSFSLSQRGSVKFTVQKKAKGRKGGKKWKSVKGSFTVAGKAGRNSFTFRGRVGGKTLKPGSYRLTGAAKAKKAGVPKRKGFRIVR